MGLGERRIGLAVSGGPDSLALLVLAVEAIPDRFEVATVDHRLRPESAAEAELVTQLCADLNVPCAILKIDVAPGNLQANARDARYRALGDWMAQKGLEWLATAHHADDQAETFLMRLNRGSGLAGLAGIRERGTVPYHPDKRLVRPLLQWRKSELEALVEGAGLSAVEDPSNEDLRFDRVKIRQGLASAGWLDPVAIAQSAALLGEVQTMIGALVDGEWDSAVELQGRRGFYHPALNGAPDQRLPIIVATVDAILSKLGGNARGSDTARMVDRLLRGERSNLAGVLATPEGSDDQPVWRFEPEPPRNTA